LFLTLGRRALLLDPWGHTPIKIHHIGFSAIRAQLKIVVREGPVDFVEKRLRHKEGAAFPAGLHLYRPDLLLGDDPEKISYTDLVPEFRCVFRARVHAGSAADALVVGVIEDPQVAFIHGFERTCWAAQLAGSATRAPAGIHPGSAKEEDDHQNHDFPAQNVDQSHIVPKKSDLIKGPVSQEPTGEKRKPCNDNDDEIPPRGPYSCLGPNEPPNQEKRGDGDHQEGHPVSELVGDSGPNPTEPGFLPQADMSSQPDGHNEKTKVKDVTDDRVKGLLGDGFVEGQKKPAEDGHDKSPS